MAGQSYGPVPLTARLFSVLPLKIVASTQSCERDCRPSPCDSSPRARKPNPRSLIPAHFVIWSGRRHNHRSVLRLEMIGPAGPTLPGLAERVGRHDAGILRRPGLPVSPRLIPGPPHRNGKRRHASRCDSRSQCPEAGGSPDLSSEAGKKTTISETNHSTNARPCIFTAAGTLHHLPRRVARHLTITSSVTPSVTVTRWCKGCTGRLFPSMSVVNLQICAAERWIGVCITIHLTPSEQGGVVSEPS